MTNTELVEGVLIQMGQHMTCVERDAICDALSTGNRHGYGNVMAWLATAWAVSLLEQGLSTEAAIEAVSNRGPYPLPYQSL
jgi:hypothetical protein